MTMVDPSLIKASFLDGKVYSSLGTLPDGLKAVQSNQERSKRYLQQEANLRHNNNGDWIIEIDTLGEIKNVRNLRTELPIQLDYMELHKKHANSVEKFKIYVNSLNTLFERMHKIEIIELGQGAIDPLDQQYRKLIKNYDELKAFVFLNFNIDISQ